MITIDASKGVDIYVAPKNKCTTARPECKDAKKLYKNNFTF